MWVKEQYRTPKLCSATVLASTAANVVNSTTILNIGSLYRAAALTNEIFINPTTVTMVAASKNGVFIPTNNEFWFVAGTSTLQTLSTAGTGLLQLTEFYE